MASVKILDHMIELNKPIPIIVQNAVIPDDDKAIAKRAMPIIENIINVLPGKERPKINPAKFTARKIRYGETSEKLSPLRPSKYVIMI